MSQSAARVPCFSTNRLGQLYADREGTEVVKGYLDKALALNPRDVFSWEQISRIYVAVSGDGRRLDPPCFLDDALTAVSGFSDWLPAWGYLTRGSSHFVVGRMYWVAALGVSPWPC